MRVHVNFFGPGSIAYLHYNIFWKLLNFLYFNGVSRVREGNPVNPSFLFFYFFVPSTIDFMT